MALALSEEMTLLKQSKNGIMQVSLKLGGKSILVLLKSVLDINEITLALKKSS